jgi:hypothetical protein
MLRDLTPHVGDTEALHPTYAVLRHIFTFSVGVISGVLITLLALAFLVYVAGVVANAMDANDESSA